MINNDNEYSTNTVTNQSKTISTDQNNSIMSPTIQSSDPTGAEQPVQNLNNDLNENESQDKQLVEIPNEDQLETTNNQEEDDEFIRITAAHQMLTEGNRENFFLLIKFNSYFLAQTYDEQKNYPAALHLYRICVDLLLEELMFTEGTEHSRVYLRDKCTAIMDRIDLLKKMLDPIPPPPPELPSPPTTTTTNEQTTKPPTDELNSLHLS